MTPRSLDGYKRLKLDEYKRYRYVSNNDVFETITHNGKLKYYQCCDGNGRTILLDVDNPSHRQIIKDMGLKFLKNDNDVYLFRNNELLYKMQEVPLNVTREDIYERMENISRKKQCQKSHRKLKALPPYEDVESEIKISDSRKKDKWWNMKIGNNTYMPEDKKAEFERDPKEDNIQDI